MLPVCGWVNQILTLVRKLNSRVFSIPRGHHDDFFTGTAIDKIRFAFRTGSVSFQTQFRLAERTWNQNRLCISSRPGLNDNRTIVLLRYPAQDPSLVNKHVCCVLMHDAKMPLLKQFACSTNYCFKELHINEY